MHRPVQNRISNMVLLVALLTVSHARLIAQKNSPPHWVGTWATSPVPIENGKGPIGQADYTLRETVHTSMAGGAFRLVISNEMGIKPLSIGAVRVELQPDAPNASSQREVRFGGNSAVVVPSGAKIYSDTLHFALPAQSTLRMSLLIPRQSIPILTMHAYANQPNFMAPGDQTTATTLTQAIESDSWLFLTAVEVQAPQQAASVVTLGDSITDGAVSSRGANLRWPDDLARRLQATPKTSYLSVVNAGIGGNRILHSDIGTNAGPNAMDRFDRDVLSQASVKYLIILEGINDIGVGTGPSNPHEKVSPDELAFALSQLVERAHTHGIKVYLGTIMPDKGLGLYYTEAGEAERQAFNQWIRSNKVSDGVIDFDKAVRDPADPQRLLPAFDGGDHIHPSDAGHHAMADAIDLSLFTR
ncbi:Lysophospholipase L1 [Granulicella pectinivorans]|uniref:Lysophospholipase L1 n=2 Tax=Granulicella pectinivorans TaxID=474950 RepID=A0A1I6MXT5_9BACT|nr:Lysophospholipase L1 [Granulicella pectinivorans]